MNQTASSAKGEVNTPKSEPYEMVTFKSSRDIPGTEALLLCTEYVDKDVFTMETDDDRISWKDLTRD